MSFKSTLLTSIVCLTSLSIMVSAAPQIGHEFIEMPPENVDTFCANVEVACLGLTPIDTDLIKNVPEEKIRKIIEAQPLKKQYTKMDVWKFLESFLGDEANKFNGTVNYLGGFSDK